MRKILVVAVVILCIGLWSMLSFAGEGRNTGRGRGDMDERVTDLTKTLEEEAQGETEDIQDMMKRSEEAKKEKAAKKKSSDMSKGNAVSQAVSAAREQGAKGKEVAEAAHNAIQARDASRDAGKSVKKTQKQGKAISKGNIKQSGK